MLAQLLASADVLVQNLAPGAAARLGLSYEALHAKHPRLIVCDISGYGDDGPYRDKKAYDLLIQSESGFLSITGTPDEPAKAGCSIADIAAGMYAYTNILAALMQRGKTGKGCAHRRLDAREHGRVDGLPAVLRLRRRARRRRAPAPRTPPSTPTARSRPATASTVMLGLQNEREWQAFCEKVLLQPALATDPRFASNAQAQCEPRGAAARSSSRPSRRSAPAQVIERLDAAQIANARMNDMADVWAHPQLQARERWREVDTPAGAGPRAAAAGHARARATARMDAVPALGQHTDAILAELGYDAQRADIARAARAAEGDLTHCHERPSQPSARRASPPTCASTTFPAPVVRRAEDLLLDWLGSALAGKGARPVETHRALRARRWARATAAAKC